MPSQTPGEISGKRARTRARLVEAAAEMFAERGFHGATLADVAARAAMTTGAIYGNFKSKEELFLAIFEAPASGVDVQFREGATLKEQMRRLGEATVAFIPTAKARGALFAEFQIYVQTHPDMQAEVERRALANAARLAEAWRGAIRDEDIGMQLEQFVVVIDALIGGLISQRLLTPSVVTDETIIAAFEALA
jgi:AcrR family transcriptional regulator